MLSNSRVKIVVPFMKLTDFSPFSWVHFSIESIFVESDGLETVTPEFTLLDPHHGFPFFQIIKSLWKFQLHDAWFFHDYKELAYDYPQNLLKKNLVYLIFQSYVLEKGCWFLNLRKIILKEQIESTLWAKI